MCFVVIVLGRLVVVLLCLSTGQFKVTLAYKSAAGSYFEYVLVSFRFNDVSILVGSIYNPSIYLYNFDILLDPEDSATSRYCDILDSLSILFLMVPLIVTRLASGTCIDYVLTKFPEEVVFLVLGFLPLCRTIAF
jgi:hypothetical protein